MKRIKQITIVASIGIIVYLFYYYSLNFYDTLKNEIERNIEIDNYEINLKNIFEFEWDSIYIFDTDVRNNEILKITGLENLNNTNLYEFHQKILFIKNNEIVHFENIEIEISEPSELDIEIVPNFGNYHYSDSKSAIYNITKHNDYYILIKKN